MSSSTKQNTQTLFANSLEGETTDPLSWLKNQFSPFRLLTTNIFTIIFVVALSLFSYEYLVEGHDEMLKHILEASFVITTLFIIIPPLLYIFSYRPLLLNMNKLQQTEKGLHLLATALKSAEDGIVITNKQGDIQWSNPAFARLSGLSASEMCGQNLRLLETEQGTVEESEQRWEALLSGRVWKEELVSHRPDGRNHTEEQIITPVRDESGDISHLIFLVKDITEQRDLERVADILATASQTLNQSLVLNHVLKRMLDLLLACVPYDNAAVILIDQESQLAVRACRGRDFESQLALADLQENPYTQKLLANQEIVLISDTAVSSPWEPFIDGLNSQAGLAVPIVVEEEVIGFCVLNKNEPDYFTPQHVEIMKALVSQAVAAIRNAQLFEQVQAGRERLQLLSHRLVEIQETERRFIAQELHDEAGQSLASLQIQLLVLEQQAKQPEAIVAGVAEMKKNVEEVAENLHRLASHLRPASLDHVGLLKALSQHVETISSQHKLIGQFEAIGPEKRLSPEVETAVYRIVQEALTNVVRHAQATRVDVILKQDSEKLIIIVEDNGIGFNPPTAASNGTVNDHLGLVGIRERAEMLGGILIIESSIGNGSTLKIEVPYDNPCPDC